MKWDVFISHASEDKENFVIPLANKLKELGVKVWLDKFELKVGDSLSAGIDEGLREAKYGIIVISKQFLSKGWTDYEYRSLLSREVGNKKVILPIWYNIKKEEVQQYSLFLSDKIALNSVDNNINEMAKKLIEVIRPDIYKIISNLSLVNELYRLGSTAYVNPNDIASYMKAVIENEAPKQEELSLDTLLLIKMLDVIYREVDNITYQDRIKIYKYNANPQREALIEIKNAIIYLQRINNENYNNKEKSKIISVINLLSLYSEVEYKNVKAMGISEKEFNEIKNDFKNFSPDTSKLESTLLLVPKSLNNK